MPGVTTSSSDGLRNLSPTRAAFEEGDERDYNYNRERGSGSHMSLDRSPSPHRDGGWSSPGLTTPYDDGSTSRSRSPAIRKYGNLNGGDAWASAKAKSARVNGYPAYQSQNKGFFQRHMRQISQSLPLFSHGGQEDRIAEKARGRMGRGSWKDVPARIALLVSRRRKYAALLILGILAIMLWFSKREFPWDWLAGTIAMLTLRSRHILVQTSVVAGRRLEIRDHTRRESRRRCYGMERRARVGH